MNEYECLKCGSVSHTSNYVSDLVKLTEEQQKPWIGCLDDNCNGMVFYSEKQCNYIHTEQFVKDSQYLKQQSELETLIEKLKLKPKR